MTAKQNGKSKVGPWAEGSTQGDVTRLQVPEGSEGRVAAGEKGPACLKVCGHCQTKCVTQGITAAQAEPGQEAWDE